MCIFSRRAVSRGRCAVSKNQRHQWLRQERARFQSTIPRLEVLSPSEKCRRASRTRPVLPISDLQHSTSRPPGESWLGGPIFEDIANADRWGCSFAESTPEACKVRIHIQDLKQKGLADFLNRSLAELMLDGAVVLPQPVQLVQEGPMTDQIRYFKAGDRTGALTIIKVLQQILPRLWLKDMSAAYEQVAWISPGSYELWLAPDGRPKDH
jgi:hypothetical protein